MSNIKSKLIVLLQISAYVDKQDSIINDQGELLPCPWRNYTTCSESLRRDLEALFYFKRDRRAKRIDLQKYLVENYGKEK
ncbi:MAG: hypothetical protein QGG48_00675 [Desulfatiglandales bacterium]|nr:hypothetical protein [Desulfatiglandales bacterium]